MSTALEPERFLSVEALKELIERLKIESSEVTDRELYDAARAECRKTSKAVKAISESIINRLKKVDLQLQYARTLSLDIEREIEAVSKELEDQRLLKNLKAWK